MEVLCFRLPGHGDATLRNMNCLRSRQHFCDVTIVASDRQTFRGHKVVLAACSPFLRDQFLLNPSSELKVSVLHSSRVVCELLQSCYTGILQFSPKEIINYLTAASYLQMEHVVEKCRGALSQYLQPRTPSPPGTIKSEESEPLLAFDGGDQHPVRCRSPPGGKGSSLQPHRNSADRQSDVHKDPNAAQDIPEFRVRSAGPSGEFQEEEEEEREDLEVFQMRNAGRPCGVLGQQTRVGDGQKGQRPCSRAGIPKPAAPDSTHMGSLGTPLSDPVVTRLQ